MREAQRLDPALSLDRCGRGRPRPDPPGGRRREDHLPRVLVRHAHRVDVRGPLSGSHPRDGPRRRASTRASSEISSGPARRRPSRRRSAASSPLRAREASCAFHEGGNSAKAFDALMAKIDKKSLPTPRVAGPAARRTRPGVLRGPGLDVQQGVLARPGGGPCARQARRRLDPDPAGRPVPRAQGRTARTRT